MKSALGQASAGDMVAALLAGDTPPSVRDLQLGDGVYAAVASIGVAGSRRAGVAADARGKPGKADRVR